MRSKLSGGPPPRVRSGLLAAGIAALALAAWLLVPRPRAGAEPLAAPVRALLVDASASVRRTRPAWVRRLRAELAAEARAAAAAGEEVLVVSFAEGAARDLGPGPPGELLDRLGGAATEPYGPRAPDGRELGSELLAAARVADGLVRAPDRPPGRVVIWTDGTCTGPDPAPLLAAWLAAGVALERRSPGPAALPDARLEELAVPRRLEEGAPLAARVRYAVEPGSGPPPRSLELAVELRGAGWSRERRFPLPLEPALDRREAGGAHARVDLGPVPAGPLVVAATLALDPPSDPTPENDARRASVLVEGVLAVGLVAAPELQGAAREWLRVGDGGGGLAGLALRPLAPGELAGALPDLHAVVTWDLAPGSLPATALAAFVRRGGGWLATGGWSLLEAAPSGPLVDLLPLRADPGGSGVRDVVLLVDGSGSMEGEPFEAVRRAAVELVAAAAPRDEISLRFFTAGLWPNQVIRAAGSPAGRAQALERLLLARPPRGPTEITPSLEQLADWRETAEREALVLLLSDGRESSTLIGLEQRVPAVLERLRAARVRLRVLAVGERADLEFLGALVSPGEELLLAGDLAGLEEIFRREVNRERLREGPALPVLPRSGAGPGDLAAELQPLPEGEPLPPLERFVRCRPEPGATVLWTGERGEPVLGLWRAGRGRAAAWATRAAPGWGPAWSGRGELFGPLLRWLARGARPDGLEAELRGRELWLRGLALGGEPWPAVLEAELLDATGGEEPRGRVQLRAPPGEPWDARSGPLPEGLEPPRTPGELVLRLQPPDGGPPTAVPLRPGGLGVPPEFEGAVLAWPGGGARGAALPPPEPRRAPHPAGVAALAAGLLALFLAGLAQVVGARRRGRLGAPGSRGAGGDPRTR